MRPFAWPAVFADPT